MKSKDNQKMFLASHKKVIYIAAIPASQVFVVH